MSDFRHWVRNLWFDNNEEHRQHGELPYTMQEYWARYKWWLKREYQYQRRQGNQ